MELSILQQILVYTVVFGAVVGIVMAAQAVMADRDAARQRIVGARPTANQKKPIQLRDRAGETLWERFLEKVTESDILGQTDDISPLRRKMIAAGYLSPTAPRLFLVARMVGAVLFPGTYLLFFASISQSTDLANVIFAVFILLACGLYLPQTWIAQRIARRERLVIEGFPDALDLMVVCVEAGLGLDAAFTRVGQELGNAHPILAREFGMVAIELRAGSSREDALRGLADRMGVEDMRAFVALLIQSVKLGSSVSQTLRVFSAEMRDKRMMRAEEKAHRLPVLLSLPLVGFILPVMVGSVLLPAIIVVIRKVMPALYGDYQG